MIVRTSTATAPDGTVLHVREAGRPDAPPLVLLHGLGQTGLAWRALWGSTLATRFRLVCPDLRGHGRSAAGDPAGLVERATWGGDVEALIDGLALDRPVVVGWSYGGVVALDHLAEHGADRLRGLVLVGAPPGSGIPDARPWFDRGFVALAPGLCSADAVAHVAAHQELVARCVDAPLPDEVAAALLGEAVLTPPSTVAGILGRTVDHRPVLAASTLPLLLATGTADRVITAAAEQAVLAVRPDAEVRRYPTGHMPFLADTAGFADDLAAFCDRTAVTDRAGEPRAARAPDDGPPRARPR